MNTNLTEILFILDRSGSMEMIANSTIESFNQFVAAQVKEAGDARLTLLLFNNQCQMSETSTPIAKVPPLDHKTYVPKSGTALLDAMGSGIDELGKRLAALPEFERPGTVIVAILTDGMENASTKFTSADVQQRIKHQTETYQWNFLFLGANQDAIATATRIGIHAQNASGWLADSHGMKASHESLSRKTRAMRKMSTGVGITEEDINDMKMQLSEMVCEEDEKCRK